jgi:hypothetical protein
MLPCDARRAEVVHPGPATAPNPARRLRFIWQRYFEVDAGRSRGADENETKLLRARKFFAS